MLGHMCELWNISKAFEWIKQEKNFFSVHFMPRKISDAKETSSELWKVLKRTISSFSVWGKFCREWKQNFLWYNVAKSKLLHESGFSVGFRYGGRGGNIWDEFILRVFED